MDARIPDFGRGSVDAVGKKAAEFFQSEKASDEKSVGLMSALDGVDLADGAEPEPAKKKWTVLLYLDGNNNLYGPAYEAMKGLEDIGSNRDVNLVVELGANPGEGGHGGLMESLLDVMMRDKKMETVKRYLVTKDTTDSEKITSPEVQDLGKQDMGDPKVVSDFLKWGIQSYPAEHYAVVFFNHGAGFAGVLSDENTHNLLSTSDVKAVIDGAAKDAGQKIDLVDFDACLMAQAEVAHAVKDGARYMVASEETERGTAQPLTQIMKDLQEGSQQQAMDPADLARLFVYESFHQPAGETLTATLSAIDLEKIDAVTKSADAVARLIADGNVDAGRVRKAIEKTQHFCVGMDYKLYNDFRDLGHFAQVLQADPKVKDPDVQKAAASLLGAVKDAVIAEEHSGAAYADCTGLSTYLPTNFGYDPKPKTDSVNFAHTLDYTATPYAKETQWDEMLTSISKDSAWHNFLKTLGLSKEGIDTLDARMKQVAHKASSITGLMLGVGKVDAHWQAFQALRAGVPKGFLGLGSTLATQLGALGGAYEIFSGVKDLYHACEEHPPEGISDILFERKDKLVNAGMEIAHGAALTAVNVGLLLGLSAGLTTAAGVLAFALPVAKLVYDVIAIRNNLKNKADEMQQPDPNQGKPVQEKLQELAAGGGHLVR